MRGMKDKRCKMSCYRRERVGMTVKGMRGEGDRKDVWNRLGRYKKMRNEGLGIRNEEGKDKGYKG